MPFPNIIYSDVTLNWHENIILCFSLSKVGLPGVRTGIIVAAPEVVKAVSSLNAIVNLSRPASARPSQRRCCRTVV